MDTISRTTQFNPDMDAYQGFFEVTWKHDFLMLTRTTVLREPSFNLVCSWEGLSNARQLPWLMVRSLDVFQAKELQEYKPWDQRKIGIMRHKLISRLQEQGETVRPMLRKKLERALADLDAEAGRVREEAIEQTLRKQPDLWEALLKHETFHTSLWSLERMCYGGLYYSYEWYLTQCLRIKKGDSDYRWRRVPDCFKDFEAAFGTKLTDFCLRDEEVQISRVARNALAHNGGRITPELAGKQHSFKLEGEEIQVNALHTTRLYAKLRDCVTDLTRNAVVMPEFQEEKDRK